ncbi:MAG: sugar phosphate isomerase/epimerase family protein [Paracoccus sp. (in: a-proteobacteria)]|uniref:sugar phosphate isomerase/epimerase family protein n=1 Tax=Paracoccus sp. TaxID=267 RepID=UPI0039189005
MPSETDRMFGVDLVTFHDPAFWGVADEAGITAVAARDPHAFWTRILDAVHQTGITGIELTFPPYSWICAVAAFGSADEFASQLAARDLCLCSAFFADLAFAPDLNDPAAVAGIIGRGAAAAGFLAAAGADVMVVGLPMRQTPGATPARLFDLSAASALADIVNRLGVATAAHGVKIALHTEAHSVFAAARDIDLMMLLTDPVFVGLCPDTAHLVLMGGDPVQIVDRHHERVLIAHWKDATGPMPHDTPIDDTIHTRHQRYFCGLGAGRVDWRAWSGLVTARGIGGWAILELDASADPVADLTQGLAFARRALTRPDR